MGDWRTWKLPQWNVELLDYFFSRRGDANGPVVVLLVTPDALARATGDLNAQASEVRETFVATVRAACRQSGSLLDDASNYQDWPRAPPDDAIPRFVSHLIFTCIAASESSDDLSNEGSYLARLRELSEDRLPDHSLQMLPTLWENLAEWLVARGNATQFRPLKLPDPGGFTRIGYTVKLAFPDRRDQRQLSELLGEAGLAGQEPPVRKVLALVSSSRARFRPSFLSAFDEFRGGIDANTGYVHRAEDHRFWAAVREAALRGRRSDDISGMDGRAQILCEDHEDRLSPFVVTDQAIEGLQAMACIELPIAYGQWRFAIVPAKQMAIDADSLRETMGQLLLGNLILPRISPRVGQGLLPMIESASGLLELASLEELGAANIVLARKDLAGDLVRFYGSAGSRVIPSDHDGWVEIRGLRLRQLPLETLEASSLRCCWILHETVLRHGIQVIGGVRADDGWLGIKEVLPKIAFAGEGDVALEDAEGNSRPLVRDAAGHWNLPDCDQVGELWLVVRTQGGIAERRAIRLVGGPASETYRLPVDGGAWIVEGVGGTATLDSQPPYTTVPVLEQALVDERFVLLGPIVGQFVERPEEAAWRISKFGGRTLGIRCRMDLAEAGPPARASSTSTRRRWRQLLLRCVADPADPGFDAARSAVRNRIFSDLPKVDLEDLPSRFSSDRSLRPLPAVDRLLMIVSGRASTHTGLVWGEWTSLMQTVLGVGPERVPSITRAWLESGNIEIGTFARWRHRCLFPQPPTLVAFRVGEAVGATIMGMMLPSTRMAAMACARRAGIDFEERTSISKFVPSTITFRASQLERLEVLARAMGITLTWLDIDFDNYTKALRHNGLSPAPLNYEEHRRWASWSLQGMAGKGAIVFEHWMRSGRPDYWKATQGETSVWSYDLNTARLWGAALIGEPLVIADAAGDLLSAHGFVPLPLARMLTVLSPGLAGPDEREDWRYRYPLSSQRLCNCVLDVLRRTYDPQRVLRAAEMAG